MNFIVIFLPPCVTTCTADVFVDHTIVFTAVVSNDEALSVTTFPILIRVIIKYYDRKCILLTRLHIEFSAFMKCDDDTPHSSHICVAFIGFDTF